MLVKIIRGAYGHRPNPYETRIVLKNSKSPAFELEDEEAKRLIGLGVAKKCADSGSSDDTGSYGFSGYPLMSEEELADLDFNEMRKLAKQYGLNSKGTKEELFCRLKEAFVDENEVQDEDELDEDTDLDEDDMPPELDAQEPL